MTVTRSSTSVLRSAVHAPVRSAGAQRAFATATAGSIPVAALNETAPVASITVAARAGPRFEPAEGAAHALKNFAFKSTNARSALAIVRETELNGGVLSAALTKEHLLLTADFLKGDEAYFAELLAEVLAQSKFSPYEYKEDVIPSLAVDHEQAAQDATVSGMDALFRTAFRTRGAGNSLFASPSAPVSLEQVKAFAKGVYNNANVAVISSGLSLSKLEGLVSQFELPAGSPVSSPPSKYFGGDFRAGIADAHGHPLPRDHFFLAFEGAGRHASAPLSVLGSMLGGFSSVKWSRGESPLSAVSQITGASAYAFNAPLQDSGLFGLHVAAPGEKLTEAAKAATQALDKIAQGPPSAEELNRAVANAKFLAASDLESGRVSSHETLAAAVRVFLCGPCLLTTCSSWTTRRCRSRKPLATSARSAPTTCRRYVLLRSYFLHVLTMTGRPDAAQEHPDHGGSREPQDAAVRGRAPLKVLEAIRI